MTATLPLVESFRLDRVHELLGYAGPCVTIILPPYQPGGQERAPAVLFKTFLQDAARGLAARQVPESVIQQLLEPLEDFAEDAELLRGSRWGSVLLRAAGIFRHAHLTRTPPAAVTVAGCFQIRPLLDELNLPPDFYVLKLFKDHVGLTRCEGLHAESVDLPPGVPQTLKEAMALEPPDHDRESRHTHLADFYKIVDRGLSELLRGLGASLVLAGVDEDTAMYRGINSYPNLLPGSIHGSAETYLPESFLLRRGTMMLHEAGRERQAKAVAHWRERAGPARFLTDICTILPAAFEGRIHKLYVDTGADHTGVFERNEYRSCGPEDLLNLAVVQTLLHGGEACALPREAMPEGAAAAAILRY